MLESKIDPTEPTPLYLQVAAEIRRAIAAGEAGPGDRLPLAKDLATVLGVNTNTVLRALCTLRDEGLLDFRRGREDHRRWHTAPRGGTASGQRTRRIRPSTWLPARGAHRHDRKRSWPRVGQGLSDSPFAAQAATPDKLAAWLLPPTLGHLTGLVPASRAFCLSSRSP